MTLTQTLFSPLAQQVQSTWDFQYDQATKMWNVTGEVHIDAPEENLKVDQTISWQFTNRLVASHEPKLRLREAVAAWGIADHPKAEAIYELLDYQFRNDRQKVIDVIFGVYEPR
ncbi:MAG TPA: hypothetical protein VEI97_12500 [bacterium]|nr:hypothetical protein [bacterium]